MSSTTDTPTDFWDNVLVGDGCWEWQRAKSHGYGRCTHNGRPESAHRVAWQLWFGPIPDGHWVLHHCDNPGCVRPAHIFLGDQTANMRDATAKGRNVGGRYHGLKTHCALGHEYTEENTYHHKGRRHCRACRQLERKRRRNPDGNLPYALRTHCPQGHPYNEVNTYRTRSGFRQCRICKAEQKRRKARLG